MFTLRPYQENAVQAWISFFKQDKIKGVLFVLPTWSGKSLVIAGIAKALSWNTIVFQPSKEILEQNYKKIKSYGIEDVSIYSASVGEKIISKITFATIWSVVNKLDQFAHFDNIIIDECHGVNAEAWMYHKFIKASGCKVLWLTATPYRLISFLKDDKNVSMLRFLTRSRPRVFEKVLHVTQVSDLYKQGFLAKLQYFDVDCILPGELKMNSSGADFDDKVLQMYMDGIWYCDRVVQVIKRLMVIGRRKVLVFTKFVADSEKILEMLKGEYVSACTVSWETPKKEREDILEDFQDMGSGMNVVLNVGVLTTGFDFPELDTVVIARPTMSLGLYYQMVGRGFRIHPNKQDCMIVDMAGNHKKFWPVEELTVRDSGNEKWVIHNKRGKILTNVIMW